MIVIVLIEARSCILTILALQYRKPTLLQMFEFSRLVIIVLHSGQKNLVQFVPPRNGFAKNI